jgi:hypothetical protein
MKLKNLPFVMALIHLILFFGTLIYTIVIADSEASMVWIFFLFIDFPVSLLYQAGDVIYIASGVPILEWLLYPPYIIHGLLGTVWWYYIGRFISAIGGRFVSNTP